MNPIYAIAGVAVVSISIGSFIAGHKQANNSWQEKWDKEQATITANNLDWERRLRESEGRIQDKSDQINQDGKKKSDDAKIDFSDVNDSGNGLRESAGAAAASAEQCAEDPTNADLRKAAAKASRMLANVLEESSRHAAQVARYADESEAALAYCLDYSQAVANELERLRQIVYGPSTVAP